VAITITRGGELEEAGSFHLKTLQLSSETAAVGKCVVCEGIHYSR
jgi:hypothetical protein